MADRRRQSALRRRLIWAKFTQRLSPTPVASYETIPYVPLSMALPPTSPYYPTAFVAGLPGADPTLPLELIYRTVELGPRTDQAKVDQWNAVVGLQGMVKGWDYQLAANYTTNQQIDSYVSGWVYASKFGELLRSGVVNPFAANTPAVLDLMRATQITGQANDNRATNYGADFKLHPVSICRRARSPWRSASKVAERASSKATRISSSAVTR